MSKPWPIRILALDIETAPNTAYVWGLFKETVPIDRLIETGRVMSFAYQWLGESKVTFHSEHTERHDQMIVAAHEVLSEADAVLTFNGESFDLPMLNREFIEYGIGPPAPYRSIDLLRVAKRRFRFTSNKMDHLAEQLGVTGKVKHSGFGLWIRCMDGEDAAWKEMEKYNRQDVKVLVDLYHAMLPWIDNHPNLGLYVPDKGTMLCTNCGSHKLQSRGVQHNRVMSYRRYQCTNCGTWMRERFAQTKGDKSILTQIGG